MKILHIQASPRTSRSASLEIADRFLAKFSETKQDCHVQTLKLWEMALPELDEHALNAKYAGLRGVELTADQKSAWNKLRYLATILRNADLIVISTPLWNFSIPYKLKQLIDLVSQKGLLFEFDPQRGFYGSLTGKTAVLMLARGLDYASNSSTATPGSNFDFQKPYLETWLSFIGIDDVHTIIVEKTLVSDQIDVVERGHAGDKAEALAKTLATRTM